MNGRLKHWRGIAVALWAGAAFPMGAHAADMRVTTLPGTDQKALILSGQLDHGDDYRFLRLALENPETRSVLLSSPGGSLDAGLVMAAAFRRMNFVTIVPPRATCASACALAWLGGTRRMVSETGRVGFHAAYNRKDGKAQESGVGNALIGSFLNEIGLKRSAIIYITQAPPEGMQWLTIQDATQIGIDYERMEGAMGSIASAPPAATPPAAPAAPAERSPPTKSVAATPSPPPPPPAATRPARMEQVTWRVRKYVSQGIQNIRTGAGTMHPVAFSIPAGTGGIVVGDCRKPDPGGGSYDWCRITWQGKTGWTSSNGLEIEMAAK